MQDIQIIYIFYLDSLGIYPSSGVKFKNSRIYPRYKPNGTGCSVKVV